MPRKTLLILLACLGLLELGVLASGYLNHHRANSATDSHSQAVPTSPASSALYIEPGAGFGWLYALVNNAQASLEMTMYELVDTTFSADLVQACQRGVKVRVILDQNLEKAANTLAYNQLSAAGPNCQVAWANPNFAATHQKTIVLDRKEAIVMSFNLTSRYYADTRDLALVDTDTLDVNTIRGTFKTDFGSTDAHPAPAAVGQNLIWSPSTAEDDLLSLISGAKETLLVENEELAAPVIVDALAAACKRGVHVSLAMTDTSPTYHANYATLEAAGCGVHIGADDNDTLYIHAKALVADLGNPAAIGYAGSINFSNASMTQNRELGLYVHDTGILQQIATTITSDYNSFPAYAAHTTLPNTQPARP